MTSGVTVRARWWTNTERTNIVTVHSDVIAAVKRALDEARIDIPYDTQVHLFHDQTAETKGMCRLMFKVAHCDTSIKIVEGSDTADLDGAIEPLISNLDIFQWKPDVEIQNDSVFMATRESSVDAIKWLLEIGPRDTRSASIPVTGSIKDAEVRVIRALLGLSKMPCSAPFQTTLKTVPLTRTKTPNANFMSSVLTIKCVYRTEQGHLASRISTTNSRYGLLTFDNQSSYFELPRAILNCRERF